MAQSEIEFQKEIDHLKFCESLEVSCDRRGQLMFSPCPPSLLMNGKQELLLGIRIFAPDVGSLLMPLRLMHFPCRAAMYTTCCVLLMPVKSIDVVLLLIGMKKYLRGKRV